MNIDIGVLTYEKKEEIYTRKYPSFFLLVIFYHILIFKQEERERVLKIGFYDNYPYFYINDNAKICGYYNDLTKSIAKRLNFKVEYVNYKLSELLKELENGEIDLVVGINKTPEREKNL